MESIHTNNYTVHFNSACYDNLNIYIENYKFSRIFLIVDSNTHEYCIPHFMAQLKTEISIEIIEIDPGEQSKTIDTCLGVWNALSELNADRKSLILNLGGGVVTDLGGFVASTFKRGIKYINIPTSLLAMVDASVGGKTGVDLGNLKNQVGVINSGDMVLIDTAYLDTLPQNHFKSGLAEMLKHGLIYDRAYWNKLKDLSKLTLDDLNGLIYESVIIKNNIVLKDPNEIGMRKHLNYGHTLGHAIESYFLASNTLPELLHGEAVAIGLILECYISSELLGFPKADLKEVSQVIKNTFPTIQIESENLNEIIDLLKYDKKNENGNVNFVLLESIGKPKIDCLVENDLIRKAFEYYENI